MGTKTTKKTAKKAKRKTGFQGFGTAATQFLTELTNHNEKAWFNANKQRYEDTIREPAREFVRVMGKKLGRVNKNLVADDRKVGGSLLRVYRDVRFSKDKTPYKTHIGVHFKHSAGKDIHAPGAYVHIGVDETFIGIGIWRPESAALAKIRQAIADDPKKYQGVMNSKALTAHWSSGGESLKRPPRGFDKDHPAIEELKRKDHILVGNLSLKEAESAELADICIERFVAAKKHMAFLCDAMGV